jgi:hypothetical protein
MNAHFRSLVQKKRRSQMNAHFPSSVPRKRYFDFHFDRRHAHFPPPPESSPDRPREFYSFKPF